MSTTTITVHITIIFTKWSFRKRPIRISFTCSHAAICQCRLFHVLSLARSGCGCWLFIVYHFMLFCRPDTQNNLLFLNAKPNVNSTENCLCTSGGFGYGKIFAFWQHSNSNFVTHHLWVLPLYDVLHRSNIVTVCCWWHTPAATRQKQKHWASTTVSLLLKCSLFSHSLCTMNTWTVVLRLRQRCIFPTCVALPVTSYVSLW